MDTSTAAVPHPFTPGPSVPAPSLPISDGPPPRRRRKLIVVAGALAMLLGALGAAELVSNAGHRTNVLALARDVPVGQQIADSDLTVAAVPQDPALTPIAAADRSQIVGKRAAVDLRQGTLLTGSDLDSNRGLHPGEQLVGVQVALGQAPKGALMPGDQVQVVSTPGKDETAPTTAPAPVTARVINVSDPDASGAVVVNLAVAAGDGPTLAARAATGRVAIVLDARS